MPQRKNSFSEELTDEELDTIAQNNMFPEDERSIDLNEKREEIGLGTPSI